MDTEERRIRNAGGQEVSRVKKVFCCYNISISVR